MSATPTSRRRRPGGVLAAVALSVVGLLVVIAPTVTAAAPHTPAGAVAGTPIGQSLDFDPIEGGIRSRGWAFDPDAPTQALKIVAVVDGASVGATVARSPYPTGTRAYPAAGPNHGFSFVIPVPEGTHSVCVSAINLGRGVHLKLACVTRTFDYGPQGALEVVDTRPGLLHVKGWDYDPDAVTTPLATVVSVDGAAQVVTANRARPDLAIAARAPGPNHGFELGIAATQGTHKVCVYAKNVGIGSNKNFGCRTVTLDDNPQGGIELEAQNAGKLEVKGWAFDHDAFTTPTTVVITVDGATARTVAASAPDPNAARLDFHAGPDHGFDEMLTVAEGVHHVCVIVRNIGYGADVPLACHDIRINFTPAAALTSLTATPLGLAYTGWASDPDTSKPITVVVTSNGTTIASTTAAGAGGSHSGHNFSGTYLTTSGTRSVCATGLNALYGTHNSVPACQTITLALRPIGRFSGATRAAGGLAVSGWTFDPDSTGADSVAFTVDGKDAGTYTATVHRPDVARAYPTAGQYRGFARTLPADSGEHTVCAVAKNIGGGSDVSLGCSTVYAVDATVPGPVSGVVATSGYNSSDVSWSPPTDDGGAPITGYVVRTTQGPTVKVSATATSVSVVGLATRTTYRFTVTAVNALGESALTWSPFVTTQAGPAPQTTAAPISTSRYIRNIRGSSAAEQAMMRAEGASDAAANPSNHRYLQLLDIGGQSQAYNGVLLSALARFVSYSDLVTDIKAYIDGYASAQRPTAPVTIAVGTNNDSDVNATTGAQWANIVVDPLVSYAGKYSGITIAGANDMEPGFSASYSQTRAWLTGYLGATTAQFVFNGSADGCSPTTVNRGCNNGWNMVGLYTLAAGAAPTRSVNLPQIYNYTMADQWKYISLTGIVNGKPRINFGGPLTEYTACAQDGSCGSIGGKAAWNALWANLQSAASLKVPSLPYSTDLRIDR